jgi:hypothetical protein
MPNVIDLLLTSEKAWRKGGGGGASSGIGGGHGKGPGSRGGKFFINPHGHVEYGAKPSGARGGAGGGGHVAPKILRTHGPSSNLRAAVARSKPKPRASAGKLANHRKMLSEMDKAIRTGKDPHGNKLSAASIEKLRFLATGLRTEVRMSSGKSVAKEVQAQIAEKASDRLPFTVFKDAKGEWRWIGVSSSAARDADGETVSLKALEADTATKDITRDYGPLNWWHTHIKLGTCDFNAMDGPLLVESGTFENEGIAHSVSKAIADGVFKPGMSLEFEHSEPGPPVLPGRVFTRINKVGRALLPAEKASNLLTSFKVYNMNTALAGKEVKEKQMIPEEKLKLLEQLVPKEFLDGLLSGNQTAIKMAEAANYSFKSMTPAPVETPAVVEVAPVAEVAPVVETAPAPVEAVADAEGVAAVEEPGVEFDTEAIFSDLIGRIKTEILAALPQQQPVATKEVTDALEVNTLAVKEVTTALNTVVAENKSLKARLDALEGVQPAAVRARVTSGQGIPAKDLPEAHKELVDPAKKEEDPYVKIASQLGLIPAPRG